MSRDVRVGVRHCSDEKVGCICIALLAGAQIANAEEKSEKLKQKAKIPFTKYTLYKHSYIHNAVLSHYMAHFSEWESRSITEGRSASIASE
jgi:hypothetical protein